MLRNLTLLIFCTLQIAVVAAQQDPLYTQYINNPFVINPAYGGINNDLNAAVLYRLRLPGYKGSPTTFNANAHISLLNNKMGAGFIIVSDKIFNTKINEVYGTYSYHIAVGNKSTLSFGLQAGTAKYKVVKHPTIYYAIDPSDPLLPGPTHEMKLQFGAGAILKSDKFFIGISVPRILNPSISSYSINAPLFNQHFYALGAYLFSLSERVRLKPSVLVMAVKGAPASVDLNASFIVYENYQAGILTRNFNTYGFFTQVLIDNFFRLGYVFEVPTGSSVGFNYTTHELTLGFRMDALKFHDHDSVMRF